MSEDYSIFMVEDDANFGAVMKAYLEVFEYRVTWIKDGKHAVDAFKKEAYDLCILDVMLPNVDGFSIAEAIRNLDQRIPLIFLTAKILKEDELRGYRVGADDYIKKPFDSEVLLFKIRAILKRKPQAAENTNGLEDFIIGQYQFNHRFRILKHHKKTIKLSPKESELLRMLCCKKGNILSREKALEAIWGESNYFTTRSMDVFITKLRKYLSSDPGIKLENIHGSGFRLMDGNEKT